MPILAQKVDMETPGDSEGAQRATFFRQSGWLMIANILGGIFMWGVHFLAKKTGPDEYGLFGAFLAIATIVPGMPLQMVFAQQTAKAIATGREGELAGVVRKIWMGLTGLWAVAAVIALALQGTILKGFGTTNPAPLWMTFGVVLISLWLPIFMGVLQGQQNFLWLGWSMLSNGIARIVASVVAVIVFKAGAVGMLGGVLMGLVAGWLISLWQTRSLWGTRALPFAWPGLLRQIIPLLIGFSCVQFLFTADTMFVKHYFSEAETGFYFSAGTLSRALIWLVGPLVAVMFPRIVHSSAKAEKSNLMGMVLLGTAILAICGAVGLSILGPFVVKIVYEPSYVKVVTKVLPWYTGAMVPLALANVLVNNLLARSRTRIVPVIVLLAIAYAATLIYVNQPERHPSLVTVLQTLGAFNLVLLAICAWFTWKSPEPAGAAP
jgi:O-antigen/teichoic acid export membrane protein